MGETRPPGRVLREPTGLWQAGHASHSRNNQDPVACSWGKGPLLTNSSRRGGGQPPTPAPPLNVAISHSLAKPPSLLMPGSKRGFPFKPSGNPFVAPGSDSIGIIKLAVYTLEGKHSEGFSVFICRSDEP